jgi:hypothetical protein
MEISIVQNHVLLLSVNPFPSSASKFCGKAHLFSLLPLEFDSTMQQQYWWGDVTQLFLACWSSASKPKGSQRA